MLHHLAGATIQVANLVNYYCHPRATSKNKDSVTFRSQRTRFCYLSHHQATKAQASLRICADSPESSMLVYTRTGYR